MHDKGRIIILFFLILGHGNHSAIWKRRKVLSSRHKQTTKRQNILICSPRSTLPTTGVPGRVLDWRDFLAADKPEEELSARPLFSTLRGPQGTRRGTYSTYTSKTMEETLGNIVVVWNLLVKRALARLSPVSTMAGQTSRGIESTKLRPNSYKRVKQPDKKD